MQIPRFFLFLILVLPFRSGAFALLGPFQPWQIPSLGYNIWGDIGGPQDLGEEFRWNVPVITYEFDTSFLEYFGEAGVVEVEKAIATFNEIPPASQIDLTLAPENPLRINSRASVLNLLSLKSYTMGMLIEELGLADPVRFTWTLRDRKVSQNETNYLVIERNFDPFTLTPSDKVNSTRFYYTVFEFAAPYSFADAFEMRVDQTTYQKTAVAGWRSPLGVLLQSGDFYTTLSRDDVGGLRYLLSTNNVNPEGLLEDVQGLESTNIVRAALRPGVNKISFQRFRNNDGSLNNTNDYWDSFVTNGMIAQQHLRRLSPQPDIAFFAQDLGTYEAGNPIPFSRHASWLTNAMGTAGPGIITPAIQLIFGKFGPNPPPELFSPRWGAFEDSLSIVIFPDGPSYQIPNTLRLTQLTNNAGGEFLWELQGIAGVDYRIESSTDLQHWVTTTNIVADTGTFSFRFAVILSNTNSFFRALRN